MSLSVISFAAYPAFDPSLRKTLDWAAFKFIRAIKGEQFSQYADVPVLGWWERLTPQNSHQAAEWFGERAADLLNGLRGEPELILVPVPNSDSVPGGAAPRTLKLAQEINRRCGFNVRVSDCLRWKKAIKSAHRDDGPRSPSVLYPELVLTKAIKEARDYILVDDVKTSGGHLRACAAKIRDAGGRCDDALCAGRTVSEPPDGAFDRITEELEHFTPGSWW